jgi:N-acylneuraminate cytidylyltransferase
MASIAVIPARGGSKSIPRKNLIDVLGHPLISYTIDSALKCKSIDRVIVSTDDPEIARCAIMYGSEVVIRPTEYAKDTSRDDGLILHILRKFPEISQSDKVIFLRPTHPIRNPETIKKAQEKFEAGYQKFSSLRSMKLSNEIVFKTWGITEGGSAIPAFNSDLTEVEDPSNAPRQVLPPTYYQDGYVEILPFETVVKFSNTAGPRVLPFIIDEYSHDIDYLSDLQQIISYLNSGNLPEWFSFPAKK